MEDLPPELIFEILSETHVGARPFLQRTLAQVCRRFAIMLQPRPKIYHRSLMYYAGTYGTLAFLEWTMPDVRDGLCTQLAKAGRLPELKWARSQGCPWDAWSLTRAAYKGHLAVVQWMHDVEQCPWQEEETIGYAAAGGHLDVIQWLRQRECPWSDGTMAWAAGAGHLHVLQWVVEHGCPWHEYTCVAAASNGHVAILEYVYTLDVPMWPLDTFERATQEGHLHVLQWGHARQIHSFRRTMIRRIAESHGRAAILEWLNSLDEGLDV